MSFHEGKTPGDNFKDKLISFFSFQAPSGKKGGLPPKAHFSIWYFVIVFLSSPWLRTTFCPQKWKPSRTAGLNNMWPRDR